jgi:hypothetical protein
LFATQFAAACSTAPACSRVSSSTPATQQSSQRHSLTPCRCLAGGAMHPLLPQHPQGRTNRA